MPPPRVWVRARPAKLKSLPPMDSPPRSATSVSGEEGASIGRGAGEGSSIRACPPLDRREMAIRAETKRWTEWGDMQRVKRPRRPKVVTMERAVR